MRRKECECDTQCDGFEVHQLEAALEQAGMPVPRRPLSRAEILSKMGHVPVFNVVQWRDRAAQLQKEVAPLAALSSRLAADEVPADRHEPIRTQLETRLAAHVTEAMSGLALAGLVDALLLALEAAVAEAEAARADGDEGAEQQMAPTSDDGGQSFCGCWYVDADDAAEQLEALREANPGAGFGIAAASLAHAWALTEQWVDEGAAGHGHGAFLRLQASKAELGRLPGFPELPAELRGGFNPRTSRFPLWQMDELSGMPLFFHHADLVQRWLRENPGKEEADMPQDGLDVTDLRVLVARMATEPLASWPSCELVPPSSSLKITAPVEPEPADPLDEPPPLEGD